MKIYKLELNIPKKSLIALLDYPGANLIKKTLNSNNLPIISLRNVKINLYVLLLSFFENRKYKKGQRYIISYLKLIKPKIVISHIDNNNFFFKLKKEFPEINFVFIQNGISLAGYTQNEILKLDWKLDYFFSYSRSFSKLYDSIFKKKSITIGSFKNNFKKIKKNTRKKRSLVFISQFTKFNNLNEKIKSGKNFYPRNKFYEAEKILLPTLNEFCVNKNIEFVISGRNSTKKESAKEKNFYKNIISMNKSKRSNFIFKKIKNEFSSYELIDKSKIVVFIDSALGYQSLARGNISLACCIRSSLIQNKNLKFGWPAKFIDEGPFWINYFNKIKILKKLEFLYNLSSSEWDKIYQKYNEKLLIYDEGNNTFKKLIKKLTK